MASLAMLQLLDWVSVRPRTYPETIDAWRSSCPRLTVWEDAVIDGLVEVAEAGAVVRLTPLGLATLSARHEP